MTKKKIDKKTRNKAIAEYELSGNASAVSKKYGIARSTLLAWLPKVTDIPCDNPEVATACATAIQITADATARSIEKDGDLRRQFFMEHYTKLGTTIDKNIQAINKKLENPDDVTLRDLASSLTALNGIVKELLPEEKQDTKTTINLLQQTLNK